MLLLMLSYNLDDEVIEKFAWNFKLTFLLISLNVLKRPQKSKCNSIKFLFAYKNTGKTDKTRAKYKKQL